MISERAPIRRYDVLIVPFPFAERDAVKRRPALALSSAEFVAATGTVVVAMITTKGHAPWPHDVAVQDLAAAGLSAPCVVRWKVETRDVRLIAGKAGSLAPRDRTNVAAALRKALG